MMKGMMDMERKLDLNFIAAMIAACAEGAGEQAEETKEEVSEQDYIELTTFVVALAHIVKAIKQGCFVQIHDYVSDGSLPDITWSDFVE